MRIQYCSDLHLEFDQNSRYLRNNPLIVSGDILILAGDIIPLHDEYLKDPFFSFISNNYKQVFWIPGNHEFYHKDLEAFSKSYNIKLRNNINIVNNICLLYEGIQFVFSTLWTYISLDKKKLIEQSVSDFDCITIKNKKLRTEDYNLLNIDSLSFIKKSLIDKNSKTIVVSHHLPSNLCNSSIHNNSPINDAFCIDLTEFIESCNANFWIYGHSHFNQKPLYLNNTVLLTNQLGYVISNEHGSFKHNAYISI